MPIWHLKQVKGNFISYVRIYELNNFLVEKHPKLCLSLDLKGIHYLFMVFTFTSNNYRMIKEKI